MLWAPLNFYVDGNIGRWRDPMSGAGHLDRVLRDPNWSLRAEPAGGYFRGHDNAGSLGEE
jgi:hypothetical protein